MDLNELEDDLLNAGKEKGKELAEQELEGQEAEGGMTGKIAGVGEGLLGSVFGTSAPAQQAEGNDADDSDDSDQDDDRAK